VFHFTWQDDFSLARNCSLEAAKGDWSLVLDADESIAARDHERIRAWLRREDLDAVSVPQRHYLPSAFVVGWQPGPGGYEEGEPYPGFVDVASRRLFRNRPSLRFRNRVHEELVSTDPRHPLAQARGDWVVHHFGKAASPDLLRTKAEAYLRIGLLKVSDTPQDPRAHFELGVQYAEMQHWHASIPCFERALALKPGFRDSHLRLATCYRQLGDYRKALDALAIAERTLPECAPEIAVEEGVIQLQRSDPASAEAAFRRALDRKSANNSVKLITAALLELYAANPGNFMLPCTPPMELMVTTWLPCFIKGKIFLVNSATPNTLVL
jgi:tetratricopeptide (TPR) repeat protein